MSITGDVEITPEDIRFSNKTFKIYLVRELDKTHLEDARNIVYEFQPPSSASLYRTAISKNSVLLNGNDICGPKDAKWMLVVYARNHMSLAFFSGDREPSLDYKVVEVSRDLCGTYGYFAPE